MKKVLFYISGIILLIEFCVIFNLIIGDEESTELSLRDNSVLVEYIPPRKPKVTVFTISREQLMSQVRIKRMCARRAAAKEFLEMQSGLCRPTAIVANITYFGGSNDKVVRSGEKGSVSGKRLRSVDTKSVRGMAWFMPNYSEENPNSPIKVPSVETWLGGEGKTLAQRIANANKELKNYFVELSVLDDKGYLVGGPLMVEIHDRGPSTSFDNPRVDGFWKTWNDLGILDNTKRPNSDSHKVNLVVRLVPKNPERKTIVSKFSGERIELPTSASNP